MQLVLLPAWLRRKNTPPVLVKKPISYQREKVPSCLNKLKNNFLANGCFLLCMVYL